MKHNVRQHQISRENRVTLSHFLDHCNYDNKSTNQNQNQSPGLCSLCLVPRPQFSPRSIVLITWSGANRPKCAECIGNTRGKWNNILINRNRGTWTGLPKNKTANFGRNHSDLGAKAILWLRQSPWKKSLPRYRVFMMTSNNKKRTN